MSHLSSIFNYNTRKRQQKKNVNIGKWKHGIKSYGMNHKKNLDAREIECKKAYNSVLYPVKILMYSHSQRVFSLFVLKWYIILVYY